MTPLRRNPKEKKIGSRGSAPSYIPEPKRPKYAHLEPLYFEDWWGDLIDFVDYPAIAKDYCHKTISGEWPACNYVKMACKRYLEMLDMAAEGKYGFTFSEAHACDFLGFVEELPLAQDNFRGVEKTELEPWQIWVGCALYGFRDARGFRYVRECYLEVPRKSAKSVLATGIALYDVRLESAKSPLVLIAASTLEQADRVFGPVKTIVENDAELRDRYKLEFTKKEGKCGINGGEIQKVASIGERQDGWNPTTIILEELHAQNPDVYAVLKSSMGSRGGQMLFQITTAGRNAFGLAWDNRRASVQIIEGHVIDYQVFAVIYTLDKEDIQNKDGTKNLDRVLTDEKLWIKACPNLGVSFDITVFHSLARAARSRPQEREEFFRTRVNIWTNSASSLFNIEEFRRGVRPELTIENFRGKKSWIGVDLSTSDDLSAIAVLTELEPDVIAFLVKHYAASDAPIFTDPDLEAMVWDWRDRELIDTSREGRVNHTKIEEDIRAWAKIVDLQVIGADPAMAGMMLDSLENDRLPVTKYLNKAYMMSAPVDDLMSRAHADTGVQLAYDGNPVTEWCFSNAHGEKRKDGTILMFKDDPKSHYKIDGAVSVAMANGLRMNPEFSDKVKRKPSVYEKRGLLGVRS